MTLDNRQTGASKEQLKQASQNRFEPSRDAASANDKKLAGPNRPSV